MRLQLVCELDEPIARPGRDSGARVVGADPVHRGGNHAQRQRVDRVLVRQHLGVEQQALDMGRVCEGIGDGVLRAVGDAPDGDLVDPERQAYRLDVLAVLGRRVVGPGGDRAPARRDRRRAGAVERAGLARAAVVVGDERVPGEESAPVRGLQAEVERLRGGLARPAREHDHHAARLADRRELLDVERHLTGGGVRVVERDAQRRADEAVVTARGKRRLRGRGRRSDQHSEHCAEGDEALHRLSR